MTNTKTKLTTEQRIALLGIIKLILVGAEVESGASQEQIEKTAHAFGVDPAGCSHSAIGERIERLDSEIGSGRSLALIQKWFEYLDRVAANRRLQPEQVFGDVLTAADMAGTLDFVLDEESTQRLLPHHSSDIFSGSGYS